MVGMIFCDNVLESLLEYLSLGKKKRKFRESLFLHLLFFKYLQFKIINIPKWHILGWHALNFCSCILEWHILLPFKGIEGLPGDTVVKKKKKSACQCRRH